MFLCIICRFETELDDVAVESLTSRVVCLRCYARETGNQHPMSKGLRRELIATLGAVDAN